jgi:hypothetical protein
MCSRIRYVPATAEISHWILLLQLTSVFFAFRQTGFGAARRLLQVCYRFRQSILLRIEIHQLALVLFGGCCAGWSLR